MRVILLIGALIAGCANETNEQLYTDLPSPPALIALEPPVLPVTMIGERTLPVLRYYNIPAGPATDTIQMFAEQGRNPYVGFGYVTCGVYANAVRGFFYPDEAARRLLDATEIEMQRITARSPAMGVRFRRQTYYLRYVE